MIPWQQAGVIESPFVHVFDNICIPYAADIMNFIILTAMLSVANSGTYAATRILWSMAKDEMAPTVFGKVNQKGVPMNALAFGALSLLTSVIAAETVYLWLISIAGMAAISGWIAITLSQYLLRKRFLAKGGKLEDLKFRTPLYPLVPLLGLALNLITVSSLAFVPDQRMGLNCGIPFAAACYLYYHLIVKKRENQKTVVRPETAG